MTIVDEFRLDGTKGRIVVRHWSAQPPGYILLLAHGYGEHAGRYDHVASHLVEHGAAVYAPDHFGHGNSEGERAAVDDIEDLVADLRMVNARAVTEHPRVPVVVLGHSMGSLVAARYAQQYGDDLSALVLSAFIGGNAHLERLLAFDPIPDVPLDPRLLSRDPRVRDDFAADPLVWHGPFKRSTLVALFRSITTIAVKGPSFNDLPTLWLHGEEDQLSPVDPAVEVLNRIGGSALRQQVYPGARHEVFNETNRDEVIDNLLRFLNEVLQPGTALLT